MKLILFLFLLSFTASAKVFCDPATAGALELRICNIKFKRMAMEKCGYSGANIDKFMRKLLKDSDIVKISCLESKESEIRDEIQSATSDENRLKAAKNFLKNYNCSSETNPLIKNMCEVLK